MASKGIIMALVSSLIAFSIGVSAKWERALGDVVHSEVSPEGCFRLDDLRPYWLLPKLFHPYWHDGELFFFEDWSPVFHRLYDNMTGELLRETEVYNGQGGEHGVRWDAGHPRDPRYITVGVYRIGVQGRCSSIEQRITARSFALNWKEP